MRHSHPSIALLLLVSALAFSGCRTSHASPASSRPSPSAASLAKPSAAPSSAQSFTRPSKHPPRDSVFSVYHNPDFGISFRYPRNYALQEPLESEDSLLLHHQQELAAEQPGAILVATVLIPDDAYPNTTFVGGHLQFAINPRVSQTACRSFVALPNSGARSATGKTFVQGIPFYWREHDPADAATAYTLREYAGFSNGNCYEFFLQVASTANDINDGPSSPADVKKVLRPLEKIVASLQIRALPELPASKGLPVVHSFTVAPISHPALEGVYRASWRVADAADKDVFVSVSCSREVGVYRVSDPASARAGFPCGIFTPAAPQSQAGSLDFLLENRAARGVPVTFTLFVLSLGYGTRTVSVPSPNQLLTD